MWMWIAKIAYIISLDAPVDIHILPNRLCHLWGYENDAEMRCLQTSYYQHVSIQGGQDQAYHVSNWEQVESC